MNITTRKLTDIQLKSSYLRLDTDVSALMESIRSVGLLHPLTVNGSNELLAGARRFQAVRELGWDEVPVQVVEQDALVQELISIDENLVRAPLTSVELEQSLNRGREIYEQLNPTANKVDLSIEPLTVEERAALKEREDQDMDSFAAITSGKTGLSKAVIKSAIKRDELASEVVKKARSDGELDATKTNEIIKLDRELHAALGAAGLITALLVIQDMQLRDGFMAAGAAISLMVALGVASLVKALLLSKLLGYPVNNWRWALVWAAAPAVVVGYAITYLPEWMELLLGIPMILGTYGYIIWRRGFGPEDRMLFRKNIGGEADDVDNLPPPDPLADRVPPERGPELRR